MCNEKSYLARIAGDFEGDAVVGNFEITKIDNWELIVPHLINVSSIPEIKDLLVSLTLNSENMDKDLIYYLKDNGGEVIIDAVKYIEYIKIVVDLSELKDIDLWLLAEHLPLKERNIVIMDVDETLIKHIHWMPTKNPHLFVFLDIEKNLITKERSINQVLVLNRGLLNVENYRKHFTGFQSLPTVNKKSK